jgi:hypothetical protein
MGYSNDQLTPIQGDSNSNLLRKLVQLFGASWNPNDQTNDLLRSLLGAAAAGGGGGGGGGGSSTVVFSFALTGNADALVADTNVEKFRAPFAFTITAVRLSLNTASTGGTPVQVDINKNGSTILSTKLTVDNNEVTSVTAATPAVISDTAVADDDEFTFDIDQIGNGAATGLKVTIVGTEV